MATPTNPFSRGYAAILSALTSYDPFKAVVKVNNIRDLQHNAAQVPVRPVNASERPEVQVHERRMVLRPMDANSRDVLFQCGYPLHIRSGDYGIDKLNLITLLAMQAMINAPQPDLGAPGVIVKWEPQPGTAQQLDPQTRRPEYTALFDVLLTFAMDRLAFQQLALT